jgi:hypothetical protein
MLDCDWSSDVCSSDLPQNRSADRQIFGELAEHVYARVFEPWLDACPAGAEFRLALISAIRKAL